MSSKDAQELLCSVDVLLKETCEQLPPGCIDLSKLIKHRNTFENNPNTTSQRTLRITQSARRAIFEKVKSKYYELKAVYDARLEKATLLQRQSEACKIGLLGNEERRDFAEKIIDESLKYEKLIANYKFFELTDNFLQDWEVLVQKYECTSDGVEEEQQEKWMDVFKAAGIQKTTEEETFCEMYNRYLKKTTCALCFTRIPCQILYKGSFCAYHYYANVVKPSALEVADQKPASKRKEVHRKIVELNNGMCRKKKIDAKTLETLTNLLQEYSSAADAVASSKDKSEEEQQQEQEEEEEEEEEESGDSDDDDDDEIEEEEEEEMVVAAPCKASSSSRRGGGGEEGAPKKRDREEKGEEEKEEEESRIKRVAWVLSNYQTHVPENVCNLLQLACDGTEAAFEMATTKTDAEDPRFAVVAAVIQNGTVFLESVHATYKEAQSACRKDSEYFKRTILTIPKKN